MPTIEITRANIAYVFTAAFAGMKKPLEWVIYPIAQGKATAQIQCDTRIAQFDLKSGRGIMSARKQGGAYGHDLMRSRGASDWTAPQELLDAINAEPGLIGNTAILGMSGKGKAQYVTTP